MKDNFIENVRILGEGEIPTQAHFVGTRKIGTIKDNQTTPEYTILNNDDIPEMAYYQGGRIAAFSLLEYWKTVKNIVVNKVKNVATKVLGSSSENKNSRNK